MCFVSPWRIITQQVVAHPPTSLLIVIRKPLIALIRALLSKQANEPSQIGGERCCVPGNMMLTSCLVLRRFVSFMVIHSLCSTHEKKRSKSESTPEREKILTRRKHFRFRPLSRILFHGTAQRSSSSSRAASAQPILVIKSSTTLPLSHYTGKRVHFPTHSSSSTDKDRISHPFRPLVVCLRYICAYAR